ncbi:MAG: hypothetical protein ACYC5V_14025 [Gemmatimonadaceae bacterium]
MRAAALAVLLAVALSACTPVGSRRAEVSADTAATAATAPRSTADSASRTTSPATHGDPADTLRGIVERVGSDPTTLLVVRGTDGAACALQMTAPPAFEGLEVTLWGRRHLTSATMMPGVSCTFAAERYAVRAVDGIAAVDGMLRIDGSSYAIETGGARRPLRDVPATLRTQGGARIYWAGPLDRAPAAYGILAPAP